MITSGRFIANESAGKENAFAVLQSHFLDRVAFDAYYLAIPTLELKDEFLRVCSTYRYLAKHGDWKVDVPGIDEVISYLTNSYKLVAVFALIESMSDKQYIDFYQWLIGKKRKANFPIQNRSGLKSLYDQYNLEYGSIRRCIDFFHRLSPEEQTALCEAVQINKKPTDGINNLAKYLYQLRSKFVHDAKLVLQLNGPIYSVTKQGVVLSTLTVPAVFRAFELGLLAYFTRDA